MPSSSFAIAQPGDALPAGVATWGKKGATQAQVIATDLLTQQRHTCLVP
jgi:hypothetical protein